MRHTTAHGTGNRSFSMGNNGSIFSYHKMKKPDTLYGMSGLMYCKYYRCGIMVPHTAPWQKEKAQDHCPSGGPLPAQIAPLSIEEQRH
jgi:hypothetical protein